MGTADLSIVLTDYNRKDAELLSPERVEVVPNGMPDPCPLFDAFVLPERKRRQREETSIPSDHGAQAFVFLFLGHCMESKGLHDAARIVAGYRRKTQCQVRLVVAGKFPSPRDRDRFQDLIEALGLSSSTEIFGFADERAKERLLTEADLLLFPTKYEGETFGLVVLEALAFGLPCLLSIWRGVGSNPPPSGRFSIVPGDCESGVEEVLAVRRFSAFSDLRQHFLKNYSLEAHLRMLGEALSGTSA